MKKWRKIDSKSVKNAEKLVNIDQKLIKIDHKLSKIGQKLVKTVNFCHNCPQNTSKIGSFSLISSKSLKSPKKNHQIGSKSLQNLKKPLQNT
jgi:hypothetical protein